MYYKFQHYLLTNSQNQQKWLKETIFEGKMDQSYKFELFNPKIDNLARNIQFSKIKISENQAQKFQTHQAKWPI